MKYSMFYASATGNTKQLAEAAEEVFAQETKSRRPGRRGPGLCGFWTNEGNAGEEVRKYLKTLHNRKVFLFGTAGFGDSKTYLDGILRNVEDSLNDTNEVVRRIYVSGQNAAGITRQI